MKKLILLFAFICFILPKPPLSEKAVALQKPEVFVVEAGRYEWAWVNARYYTCIALPQKERF